jgi:hypothetical protein
MKTFEVEIKMNVKLTDEDIDDIMCAALEGGISYWCRKAEVVGEYFGDYASEQISRGGTLKLYDSEDDEVYELTLEKLLRGFELWVIGGYDTYEAVCNGEVDTMEIDAEKADQIVQLALFDEIIYG